MAHDSTTPQKMAMCISQRWRLRCQRKVWPKMSVHQATGISTVYRRKLRQDRKLVQPALK
jgi:hypothetical protein